MLRVRLPQLMSVHLAGFCSQMIETFVKLVFNGTSLFPPVEAKGQVISPQIWNAAMGVEMGLGRWSSIGVGRKAAKGGAMGHSTTGHIAALSIAHNHVHLGLHSATHAHPCKAGL